ncbi:MAG: hypothetical protein KZQ77_14285, partial [Candidatus Thiodiazotropha sp. (ex Notomyrtea botanica)]|nr:hypothetical protein [Candidatus Thiodiazotropha sp. (ex Notomyrtea botanica)]
MIQESQVNRNRGAVVFLLFCLFFVTSSLNAAQFNLNVVDKDGNPVSGFRYLVQEDTTFPVDPAIPATNPDELLSMSFHASNHPPAVDFNGNGLSGNEDTDSINIIQVAPGRYYVSVLPYSGYSISGNQATVLPNAEDPNQTLDNVTVVVQKQPIPTSQISIYLFHDNAPINGAPDLPEETDPGFELDENGDPILVGGEKVPLPGHVDWTNFQLFLEEPAGRYGQNGGQVIQDVFGNPLGTTYLRGCDANGDPYADIFTNYGCFDANGDQTVDTLGDGTLQFSDEGYLTVKNIAPGKYGVVIIPPESVDPGWQQTTTIEGTKVIDAWVKA